MKLNKRKERKQSCEKRVKCILDIVASIHEILDFSLPRKKSHKTKKRRRKGLLLKKMQFSNCFLRFLQLQNSLNQPFHILWCGNKKQQQQQQQQQQQTATTTTTTATTNQQKAFDWRDLSDRKNTHTVGVPHFDK